MGEGDWECDCVGEGLGRVTVPVRRVGRITVVDGGWMMGYAGEASEGRLLCG